MVYTTTTRGPSDVVVPLREAARSARVKVHFLDSQKSVFTLRNTKDLRQMQTLSYFHLNGCIVGLVVVEDDTATPGITEVEIDHGAASPAEPALGDPKDTQASAFAVAGSSRLRRPTRKMKAS